MIKKIRGHRRRWKQIDRWVNDSKKLDLELLKQNKYEYTKILIRPWSGISITNSVIPELRGKTKRKILIGLIEIYNSWIDKMIKSSYEKIEVNNSIPLYAVKMGEVLVLS